MKNLKHSQNGLNLILLKSRIFGKPNPFHVYFYFLFSFSFCFLHFSICSLTISQSTNSHISSMYAITLSYRCFLPPSFYVALVIAGFFVVVLHLSFAYCNCCAFCLLWRIMIAINGLKQPNKVHVMLLFHCFICHYRILVYACFVFTRFAFKLLIFVYYLLFI